MAMPSLPRTGLLGFLLLLMALGSSCAESELRMEPTPEFYDDDASLGDPSDEATDDDDDDGEDTGANDEAPEALHLLSMIPEAGSATHLYRHPLRLSFSGYAAGVWFDLSDVDGTPVPFDEEWGPELKDVDLHPTSVLRPDHPYRLLVGIGDALFDYSFRTSEVGLPVTSAEIDGAVFALEFSSSMSSEAPDFAQRLVVGAASAALLLEPSVGDAGGLSFELAFALQSDEGLSQSECSATTSFAPAMDSQLDMEADSSFVDLSGSELAVPLDDLLLEFEYWSLIGDFAPGGSAFEGVEFAGDLRAASLGLSSEAAACEFAQDTLGLDCAPCLSSPEAWCLPVSLAGLSGDRVSHELTPQAEVDSEDCIDGTSGLLTCSQARAEGLSPLAMLLGLLVPITMSARRRSAHRS